MAADESTSAAHRGKPLSQPALLEHVSIAPTPSGTKLVVTATISVELDDASALDLIMKAAGAIARMRGGDR